MPALLKRLFFLNFAALQPSAALALPHQTLTLVPAEVPKVGIDAQQLHDGLCRNGAEIASQEAFKTDNKVDQINFIEKVGASTPTALAGRPSHENSYCKFPGPMRAQKVADELASGTGDSNESSVVAEEASRLMAVNHTGKSIIRRDDMLPKSGSERSLRSLMIRGNTHRAPSPVFIDKGQVLAYSNRAVQGGIEARTKFIFDEDFGGDEQLMEEQMTAEAMLTLIHLQDCPTKGRNEDGSYTLGAKALEMGYQVGWAVSRRSHNYDETATRLIGAIQFSALTRAHAIYLLKWYKTRGDAAGEVSIGSVVLTSEPGSEGPTVIRKLESFPHALKHPRDCINAFTAGALNNENDLTGGGDPTIHIYIDRIKPDQVICFYSTDPEPKKTKVRFVFPDSFDGNNARMSEQMYAEAAKALEKLQERPNRSGDPEGDKVLKIPYDAAWALDSGHLQGDRGSILFRGMAKRQAEWLLLWFRDRTPMEEDIATSDGVHIVTRNFAVYPSTTPHSRTIIDAFSAGAGPNYNADNFAFINKNPLYTHEDNHEDNHEENHEDYHEDYHENGLVEYDPSQDDPSQDDPSQDDPNPYNQNRYGPNDYDLINYDQHGDIPYNYGGNGEVDTVMDDVSNTQPQTGPAVVGVWSIAGRAKFIFPHTFGSDERKMRIQMIAEYAFAIRYLIQVSGVINAPRSFDIGWTYIYSNGIVTPAGSLMFEYMELQWAQSLQAWYMSRQESTGLLVISLDILQRFDVSDIPAESHVIGYPATRDVQIVHEIPETITVPGNTVKRDDSRLTDSKSKLNLAVRMLDQIHTERSAR